MTLNDQGVLNLAMHLVAKVASPITEGELDRMSEEFELLTNRKDPFASHKIRKAFIEESPIFEEVMLICGYNVTTWREKFLDILDDLSLAYANGAKLQEQRRILFKHLPHHQVWEQWDATFGLKKSNYQSRTENKNSSTLP